jgi:hypothetical protein
MPTGRYINVTGNSGGLTYVNSSSNPMQGALRIQNNDMQVFDGSGWIGIGGAYSSIGLTPEAETILEWAKKKMVEEAEDAELRKKFPTLDTALKDVEVAKKQASFIRELVKSHNDGGGEQYQNLQSNSP